MIPYGESWVYGCALRGYGSAVHACGKAGKEREVHDELSKQRLLTQHVAKKVCGCSPRSEPTGEAPPWAAVARWATGEDACAEWSDLSAQNPFPKAALRCSKDDGVAARRNENVDEGFYPTGWGIHYPAAPVTVDTDDPGSFFEGVALGPPRDGEERAEDCNDCCLDDFDIIDND